MISRNILRSSLLLPHEAKIFSTTTSSWSVHLDGWHDSNTSNGANCRLRRWCKFCDRYRTNSKQTAATPDHSGQNLVSARKINATTIELINNQQQRITLDFYGNGIFRLYLDPAGRAPHNPEAIPAADILVENPRRGVKSLDLKGDANNFTVTTPQVTLVFDRATGGLW